MKLKPKNSLPRIRKCLSTHLGGRGFKATHPLWPCRRMSATLCKTREMTKSLFQGYGTHFGHVPGWLYHKGHKRVPQASFEEPVRAQGCQKDPPRVPQAFFEEPGAHKGWRQPKAAATLCVGGRRPPQVPQKRLGGPLGDPFGKTDFREKRKTPELTKKA